MPPAIEPLTKLMHLDLHCNPIVNLLPGRYLSRLELLDLSCTAMSEARMDLIGLRHLHVLKLPHDVTAIEEHARAMSWLLRHLAPDYPDYQLTFA